MILVTDRFKGNLLDMIGKTGVQAIMGLAPPQRVIDGGGYERLAWDDMVRDGDDGRRVKEDDVGARLEGGNDLFHAARA